MLRRLVCFVAALMCPPCAVNHGRRADFYRPRYVRLSPSDMKAVKSMLAQQPKSNDGHYLS